MITKIEKLLDQVQGNCYPAMLADLGKNLGVSESSLRRLALGWLPIVEFKRGRNFQGWFVVPERDPDGVPVGLSLRSQTDHKVMHPGSKHGLIYEVNEKHERGLIGNDPGQWIRTMDAGVLCPVCGKPDGCLTNSLTPGEGDAICIRIKDGAVRPMKFGYLHSTRERSNEATALADHGGPIIVVEGMSDAASALDLGFDSVGRPSNLACMDMLCDLVRGRSVIVVGENDKKLDGREPGREGMIAAFQMVKRVSKGVTMLMPPAHVKDLRAWVVKFKLTKEQFLDYHEDHQEESAEELTLADARPLTIARAYLNSTAKLVNRYILRRWQGSWWRYGGSKYTEVKTDAFRQPIYPWSHDKQVLTVNPSKGTETLTPLVCNTSLIVNLEEAIGSETLVPDETIPCWINNHRGPDPRDLIVFENGILHVPSFLSGAAESEYLLDSTPDLFTTVALPFSFDPTASCPLWENFLVSTLGDDDDKIRLLREWFGYCLTPDTSFHKLMYMRGPVGAGKSVILNMLCRLVGENQSAATSFADLAGSFGTQSLVGKMICVIPDIRVSARTDVMRGLELLLNITSGDGIQINRKFKDPLDRVKLMTRITVAGNDFIDVPDHAGAMVRRLNVIEFKNSFVGREDFGLENKMIPEIPGIALWALTGLRDLRANGQFTVPETSTQALEEWRRMTSPLAGFLEECTDRSEKGQVLKEELYDAWVKWSEERRLTQIGKAKFFERIRANAPHAISDSYERGGHKFSCFRGLMLQQWAARKFLGKP